MTSFITTMFVSHPSPQWRPHPPSSAQCARPLPPICTELSSCVHLESPDSSPITPQPSYKSPLQRVFEGALRSSPTWNRPSSPISPVNALQQRNRGDSDASSVASDGFGGVSLFGYTFGMNKALHDSTNIKLVNEGLHELLARSNSRSRNAFKPQKANRGTTSWQLKQFAEATLGSGSLRKAVKLPEGEDRDEWLAVNGTRCYQNGACSATNHRPTVVDFYNQINLLYGSITEFCSPQTCPEMKATDELVPLS